MYYITKEVLTETAHRLYNHKGKCNNIHGHTYKWQVTLKAKSLDETSNMVLDFALLKELITAYIVDVYDHSLILNKMDTSLADCMTGRVLLTNGDPTAELMAKSVFNAIQTRLTSEHVFVHKVSVWETPTSFACYKETE